MFSCSGRSYDIFGSSMACFLWETWDLPFHFLMKWMKWNCGTNENCYISPGYFCETIFLKLGGGFKHFFIFTPIWGRFPIWLIFFRWVETTNLKMIRVKLRRPAKSSFCWCLRWWRLHVRHWRIRFAMRSCWCFIHPILYMVTWEC